MASRFAEGRRRDRSKDCRGKNTPKIERERERVKELFWGRRKFNGEK